MSSPARPRPLVVVILDGWGISMNTEGNAIRAAKTPTLDSFAQHFPTASLQAASTEVGLPWGEVGNSETGHTNIGSGHIHYQALPRIDEAIKDGSFQKNPVFKAAIDHAEKHASRIHLMGLASTGGVHSHLNHLLELIELAAKKAPGVPLFVHVFTDGRDVQPQSAESAVTKIEKTLKAHGNGSIATVTGRFYAMDRNINWERTKATYALLTKGTRTAGAPSAAAALQQAYEQGLSDEVIPPTAITRGGKPVATMQDNDSVIFFNFRPDRARQLTHAFTDTDFTPWQRIPLKKIYFATMMQYDPELKAHPAYVEEPTPSPVAKVIADAGLRQLHIAETEKYAHVTYYLNGGHEEPFPGEERVMLRSSSTKNFAAHPHLEAKGITDKIVAEVKTGKYDVYFVNYANADMVGHTGDFKAAVAACSFVDACLTRLVESILPAGGALLVTADHGNAEEMIHPTTQEPETEHSSNPVPIYYVESRRRRITARSQREIESIVSSPIGVLSDVGPTILDILALPKPSTMTGVSLLSSLQ